ncbi:MAG TPA: hypothetical protein VIX19_07500 [Terriglobales bacterium]
MNSTVAAFVKLAVCVALVCWLAGSLFAQNPPVDSGLVAHEWGTFTSVAGNDGQAVEWSPFSPTGPDDLPGFVEHLHWIQFKQELRGTVRMETPVLYFYSQQSETISVHVGFVKGIITEWYPHADQPARDDRLNDAEVYRQHGGDGSISWNSVAVEPKTRADFPQDLVSRPKLVSEESSGANNRYYAARQTASAPLRVRTASADQHEKFLFYRGVASFPVPLTATFTPEGKVAVNNSFAEGVSTMIWFERRGEQVGYRVSQEIDGQTVLDPPEMTARLEHVYADLEEMLVARGLYRDEAHAMIETWQDSWFEEGSRLLYMVPVSFVDSVLPLTIKPAPAQTARVFVGRMELVSPATKQAVAAALAADDQKTLAQYGRFLSPIMEMIETATPQANQNNTSLAAPCLVEPAVARTNRQP